MLCFNEGIEKTGAWWVDVAVVSINQFKKLRYYFGINKSNSKFAHFSRNRFFLQSLVSFR